MVLKDKEGREVEIEVGGRHRDDIQVESAVYVDTGEDAGDDVVDYIMDTYADKLDEVWLDRAIMAAEVAFEGDR